MHILSIIAGADVESSIRNIARRQVEYLLDRGETVTVVSDSFPTQYASARNIVVDWTAQRGLRYFERALLAVSNRLPNGATQKLVSPRNLVKDIEFPKAVARWLGNKGESLKIDCILCNQCLVPPWLFPIARQLRTPVVFLEHGDVFTYGWKYFGIPTTAYYRWAMRKIYRWADHLVELNPCEAESARASGVPSERASIIPNGIDLQEIASDDGSAPLPRQAQSEILFVGEMADRKGVPELLGALAQLKAKSIHCRLVGGGQDLQRYEAMASKLGIQSICEFVGQVPRANLARYYRAADVFVLPSHAEGLPVVLLEAMACGLPSIAIRIPGIQDVIEHGKDGLLVQPKSPDELAKSIAALYDDGPSRREMGCQARNKAADFSWNKVLSQLQGTLHLTVDRATASGL
jgi:glycosyltransferase involved in cell wall biosynthesis